PTAIMILAVQALDGREGLVIIDHFHEAKSPAPTRLAVAQDLGGGDRPVLLEDFLELLGSDSVLEVANVKPLRHRTRPKKALHRPPRKEPPPHGDERPKKVA